MASTPQFRGQTLWPRLSLFLVVPLSGATVRGEPNVVKPEWGSKRTCPRCSTRFYDLGKEDPVTCISCGVTWLPEPILKSKQPLPFEEVAKTKARTEGDDVELVDDEDLLEADDLDGADDAADADLDDDADLAEVVDQDMDEE
ncbi:FYDLN acid domain-containing protein [Pedomonas sp.]|uniref:FYDLN acid domain-containing protein n=1 Tax=Pedomonas sp. TaxID=2976421 RepID=UPI0039C8DC1E